MNSVKSDKFDKIIKHLEKELTGIRTGRAMPNLVENIMVEAYGNKMPLNQLASISAPETQTLVIQPWDVTVIKAVEKALQESSLDLNPVVDEKIIRINFSPLTEEKRKELVKLMRRKVEEAKIGVKMVREELLKKIKNAEKNKEISEDDRDRQVKELQEKVDEYNKKIKEIHDNKEQELMTI